MEVAKTGGPRMMFPTQRRRGLACHRSERGRISWRSGVLLIGTALALVFSGSGLAAATPVHLVSHVVQNQLVEPAYNAPMLQSSGSVSPLDGWGEEPPPDGYQLEKIYWGYNYSATTDCVYWGQIFVEQGWIYDFYCRQMSSTQADLWVWNGTDAN